MNAKAKPVPSKFVIARNVKALRGHYRWSQAKLANLANVSQSTVSNMEVPERATPRYSPTTDNVDAVAAVFGLTSAVLAMPLPLDVLLDFGRMEMVIADYAESQNAGRRAIEAVAELSRPRYLPASEDANKHP